MTVDDVWRDARGIVAPDRGLRHFTLDRHAPSPVVARLVDRYWVVRWNLPDGDVHHQQVLPHPVTNIVFEQGGAVVGGVTTTLFTRALRGHGSAVGVMFRPGGFRPLIDRPMRELTDRALPLGELLGPEADVLARQVARDEQRAAVARIDAMLSALVPADAHPAEAAMRLAEHAADDRGVLRTEQLADVAGVGVRTLQRRFADHIGISPKAVIRRYRLYEVAEAARQADIDWGALAADLGYADQAHLIRDFRTGFGVTPAAYAPRNRAR
jgi:AraC-like DNA-binding protein